MTPLTRPLYFTTSTVIDWVDIFTRASYRHVIVESLAYCQKAKGLRIYAWVLMSNHLHMVVSTEGEQTIGDILRDFKKFTNKKILKALEVDDHESRRTWMLDRFRFAGANDKRITNYRFWQEGNHVEDIYTLEFLWQKINYIHLNPVRAEIVAKPEDYLYSSGRDYAGEKGLLAVEIIRFSIVGRITNAYTRSSRIANSAERVTNSAERGLGGMLLSLVPKSDIIVPNSLWLFGIFVVPLHP